MNYKPSSRPSSGNKYQADPLREVIVYDENGDGHWLHGRESNGMYFETGGESWYKSGSTYIRDSDHICASE